MSLHLAGDTRPGHLASRPAHADPARTPEILRCHRLRHHGAGQWLIDGVSITIRAGEAVAIVAPDTAARHALIGMVCGLLTPDSGNVHVLRRPIGTPDPDAAPRTVAYVAQNAVLVPSGTMAENLALWARITGVPAAEQHERVCEVLAQVGLATHRDDPVAGCPAGTARELSVAVALLTRPRLLVLDEPTRGLGPRGQARLVATLAGLRADGMALLCSVPESGAVPELCDPVLHLSGGRFVADSSTPTALTA